MTPCQAPTRAPTPSPTLRSWLDQAQARHTQQPAAVAAELADLAGALPADADGVAAIVLAEHVWLGHLADACGLHNFVARLPGALRVADTTAPAVQRAVWAQALLAGQPVLPLPDALRWRALQNVLLAMALQGRSAAALPLLLADEDLAAGHGSDAAGRAFAATANNLASDLCAGARGDDARDALMLAAAKLSRRAWGRAGTPLHVERAEYRLALCHASVGQGAAALQHAHQCLAMCRVLGQPADGAVGLAAGDTALELFFAHEALVLAHRAGGDAALGRRAQQQMQTLLPAIDEADGMRAWCVQVLAALAAA